MQSTSELCPPVAAAAASWSVWQEMQSFTESMDCAATGAATIITSRRIVRADPLRVAIRFPAPS
jgi:hypothetical protein